MPVSYERQGYIYFKSRCYRELPEAERRQILDLCLRVGGEKAAALIAFVTTDATATEICGKHYISRSTLERIVRRYYKEFPF